MPNVTPLIQPPVEDLRNALQIAQLWNDYGPYPNSGGKRPFGDIARLLRHALEGLGEPNEAALQAAMPWVHDDSPYDAGPLAKRRAARDLAAAILNAQLLTGKI